MYYYKARIYSPKLGRFMQTDPIGYDDNVNLYAYTANDPINMTDPTGMYECEGRQACDVGAKAKKQIDSAIKTARSSRRAGAHSRAGKLRQISKALGSENDDNGLTIEVGKTDSGNAAVYNPENRTITVNKNNANGTRHFGIGAIVAHEVSHHRDNLAGKNLQGRGRVISELHAYSIQFQVQAFSDLNRMKSLTGNVRAQIDFAVEQSSCGKNGIPACRSFVQRTIENYRSGK